jgi:uncharacterized membrane protein (TIGR02234 family)
MRERSFAPTVLLGLGGAALAAVAGTKDWVHASGDAAGTRVEAAAKGSESAPLVVALALVALAAWGVVLVVRGRARQIVAAVGALAILGALVAALTTLGAARHGALAALRGKGLTGTATDTAVTGWYVTVLVASVIALAAFAVAVGKAPRWPSMGSRYDAPGARDTEPATEQDMWRALDEGHDPTA